MFCGFKKFSTTSHFQELTLFLWTFLFYILFVLFGGCGVFSCLSEGISCVRHEATCKGEINTRKDSSLNFVTILSAGWKFFIFICVHFSVFLPWSHFSSLVFLILAWLSLPLLDEWLHFPFSTCRKI